MVHAGGVFVAGIHLSRTWMSGSFALGKWRDLHLHPSSVLNHWIDYSDTINRGVGAKKDIIQGNGTTKNKTTKQNKQKKPRLLVKLASS